jgi:hypothetical protein
MLFEMLLPISLGPEHARRMRNAIEVWASWMNGDESTALIDQINRMPLHERKINARRLGQKQRVSNRERERLKLKTIRPFDMTDKQLKDERKEKQRAREQRRRRAAGSRPRGASLARQKPWEADGISRGTWFRRRAKRRETNSCPKQESRETNSCAIKLSYYRARNGLTEQDEKPEERAKDAEGQREQENREVKPC